ncbi:hypothetical protein LOAG_08339, partial [Loa loa]
FTEVLRLVSNSVENLQQLPCTLDGMIDGEYVNHNNLVNEAKKLLTMCTNIQQKIMNAESISTTESNYANNGIEPILSTDDRIINTSDLNSEQQQ